jgi:hypothetical protein
LVEVNVVILALEEQFFSQNAVLDDNALNPRNECCLLVSQLSGLILEEAACCCIEVIHLAEPVLEQRIAKEMVNRPCKHMPDIAQQLH